MLLIEVGASTGSCIRKGGGEEVRSSKACSVEDPQCQFGVIHSGPGKTSLERNFVHLSWRCDSTLIGLAFRGVPRGNPRNRHGNVTQ